MSRYTCTCLQCSVTFHSDKNLQRYCGIQCRIDARKTRHTMTCKQCGEQYEARDREVKAGKGNFCSTRCHNASKGSAYPITRLFELAVQAGYSGITSRFIIETLTPGLTGEKYRDANKLVGSTMSKLATAGKVSKSKKGRVVTYRLRVNQLSAIGDDMRGVKRAGQRIALPGSTPIVEIAKKVAGGFVGPVIVPDGVKFTRCPSPTHDDRFQLAPGTRVVGGFATMGVGAYL